MTTVPWESKGSAPEQLEWDFCCKWLEIRRQTGREGVSDGGAAPCYFNVSILTAIHRQLERRAFVRPQHRFPDEW